MTFIPGQDLLKSVPLSKDVFFSMLVCVCLCCTAPDIITLIEIQTKKHHNIKNFFQNSPNILKLTEK